MQGKRTRDDAGIVDEIMSARALGLVDAARSVDDMSRAELAASRRYNELVGPDNQGIAEQLVQGAPRLAETIVDAIRLWARKEKAGVFDALIFAHELEAELEAAR